MNTLLAWSPGMWEMLVILVVVLVLFGAGRLPKLARSLGQSMTEFKKGLRGDSDSGPDADEGRKNLDEPDRRVADDAASEREKDRAEPKSR